MFLSYIPTTTAVGILSSVPSLSSLLLSLPLPSRLSSCSSSSSAKPSSSPSSSLLPLSSSSVLSSSDVQQRSLFTA